MTTFKERYLEAFTDTISNILQTVGTGERELTKTDIILLNLYKKEIIRFEKKPQNINIVSTINSVLSNLIGGDKQ